MSDIDYRKQELYELQVTVKMGPEPGKNSPKKRKKIFGRQSNVNRRDSVDSVCIANNSSALSNREFSKHPTSMNATAVTRPRSGGKANKSFAASRKF